MVYVPSIELIQYTPLKESALEMSLSEFRQRPLRVISRQFSPISTNGGFGAYSGRSDAEFREPDFINLGRDCERLLFPVADVQVPDNRLNRGAAFGQKRSFMRCETRGYSAVNTSESAKNLSPRDSSLSATILP
jgi:hypothetical protein